MKVMEEKKHAAAGDMATGENGYAKNIAMKTHIRYWGGSAVRIGRRQRHRILYAVDELGCSRIRSFRRRGD